MIDCFVEIPENLYFPIGANLSFRDTDFSRKHNLFRIPKPSKLDQMSFSIYFHHGVNRVSLKKIIFFKTLSDWRTPKKIFFFKNKKCPKIIDCLSQNLANMSLKIKKDHFPWTHLARTRNVCEGRFLLALLNTHVWHIISG